MGATWALVAGLLLLLQWPCGGSLAVPRGTLVSGGKAVKPQGLKRSPDPVDLIARNKARIVAGSSAMASLDAASSLRWEDKKEEVLSWTSNERMTDKEIGITEYVKPKRPGTGGVMKMCWSDFRVMEVRERDNTVVALTNTSLPGAPPLKSSYLRFVLAKAGYDTVSAVGKIASHLRVRREAFAHAGIKDKSAVTCQEVSWNVNGLKTVNVHRLLNISGWLPRLKVGNFEYTDLPMKPGVHAGNKFAILLRRLSNKNIDEVRKAADSIESIGFINYYGHQRFGLGMRSGMPSMRVGKAILQDAHEEAVLAVMDPEWCVDEQEKRVKTEFTEGFKAASAGDKKDHLKQLAFKACGNMPKHCFGEINMLETLAQGKTAFQALGRMPNRVLYMLAFWSRIWNRAVSERIRRYGAKKAVVGDLVCTNPDFRGVQDGAMDVKVVTEKDIKTEKYSIFDVVIPLPGKGCKMVYPEHEVGDKMKKDLEKEGMLGTVVDPRSTQGKPCLYRHILVRPADFSYEILHYDNEGDLKVADDPEGGHFASMSESAEPPKKKKKKERDSKKRAHADSEEAEASGKHLALALSFKLPAAAFATSLIREITKETVHPNASCESRKILSA